jgi:hypothetical protein
MILENFTGLAIGELLQQYFTRVRIGEGYYKWVEGAVIGANQVIPTPITVTTITNGGPRQTVNLTINPTAPANDPKIVVAVMIEFGGHGTRAAQIASKIIAAYLKVTPIVDLSTDG